MKYPELNPQDAALLIVDVQEKLFPLIDHPCEVLEHALKLIQGCKLLDLPVIISEQYPKGLGSTIPAIKELAGPEAKIFSKTSFSCLNDPVVEKEILDTARSQWIVIGIEAHVCILQTVRSLLKAGKHVVIANDAISSRSIYDFSTAIAELRDMGARISSTETILFDLMRDSKHPQFKALSALIKS
jgi:nicotinamidase-related amidase